MEDIFSKFLKETFGTPIVDSKEVVTFQKGNYETTVTIYFNKSGKAIKIEAENAPFKDEKARKKEQLIKELKEAVANWKFEEAARLRDLLEKL